MQLDRIIDRSRFRVLVVNSPNKKSHSIDEFIQAQGYLTKSIRPDLIDDVVVGLKEFWPALVYYDFGNHEEQLLMACIQTVHVCAQTGALPRGHYYVYSLGGCVSNTRLEDELKRFHAREVFSTQLRLAKKKLQRNYGMRSKDKEKLESIKSMFGNFQLNFFGHPHVLRDNLFQMYFTMERYRTLLKPQEQAIIDDINLSLAAPYKVIFNKNIELELYAPC